jgi:outer membrane protein OmpA-like peptidoglycan-associated protein
MKQRCNIFTFLIATLIFTGIPAFSEPSRYDQLLKIVNTDGDETSCAFSSDRNLFVFTRKAKNSGNYDLYSTEFKNGEWSAPEAILQLNTDHDEISPFITADGKHLVFSSNRPGSLQNKKASKPSFDIYVSEKEGDTWSAPFPIFGAINSTDDETNPYITPDGNMIYFTRTKFNDAKKSLIIQAERRDDIWGVNMMNSDLSYITSLRAYMVKKSADLPGFWVSAYEKDKTKRDIFFVTIDSGGNREVINPGEAINTDADENSIYQISGELLALSVNSGISGSYDIAIKNIPGDLIPDMNLPDKGKIEEEDAAALQKGKKGKTAKKKVPGEITESIFVIDVTSSGIDDIQNIPLRIILFDNLKEWSNPVDSAVVSPDSNNRIEIKTSDKIKRIVIIPENDSVDGFAEEYIIGKNGVMTGSLNLKKTENKEFKIRSVYFRFNSSDIQLQEIPYLHDLLDYMRKNSDVRLSIEGYSDSQGTDRANMAMSIRRAESVRDYLVKMGIDNTRLTARGHGFVHDKNGGTSQQQRRVDFILSE